MERMEKQSTSVQSYMEQEIAGKSTAELALLLYETGQRACRRRDRQLAIGVLVELMGGVDIRAGELAAGLVRLYEYALRQVRENRFGFAEKVMRELGEAYRRAHEQLQQTGEPLPESGH